MVLLGSVFRDLTLLVLWPQETKTELCVPHIIYILCTYFICIYNTCCCFSVAQSWPSRWWLYLRLPPWCGIVEFGQCSSVTKSHSTLQPHRLQHARLPCPSLSFRVCSDSCPLSQWCHPTISSSVIPFSCLHSFPASGSFPVIQLFASSGQSIGASASASVRPMNIQDWFPLGLTDLISLQSKRLSSLLHHPSLKAFSLLF